MRVLYYNIRIILIISFKNNPSNDVRGAFMYYNIV